MHYPTAAPKTNHSEGRQEGSDEIVLITFRARDDRTSSAGRICQIPIKIDFSAFDDKRGF
jgi:hypothetical protein